MKATHPTIERFQARLAPLKCTAKTARGLRNFWLSLGEPQRRSMAKVTDGRRMLSHQWAVESWEKAVAARKADGDAKRARQDKTFRPRYLARLRRREQAALRYSAENLDVLLAWIDSRDARTAELIEVARLRSIVLGKHCEPLSLGRILDGVTVPIDVREAKKLGADIIMRGRNAELMACRVASYGKHVDHVTTWRNGQARTLVSSLHHNYVRSIALVEAGGTTVEYHAHRSRFVVTLPDGYRWGTDDIGLFAACGPDEYHVTCADLIVKDAADRIAEKVQSNKRRREEMRLREVAEKATLDGVYVCLADSLRGGNCLAGTLKFGQAHNLNPDRHYEAQELIEMSGGDYSRVRLAITAARIRHAREMEAGVCHLADHRQGVYA